MHATTAQCVYLGRHNIEPKWYLSSSVKNVYDWPRGMLRFTEYTPIFNQDVIYAAEAVSLFSAETDSMVKRMYS